MLVVSLLLQLISKMRLETTGLSETGKRISSVQSDETTEGCYCSLLVQEAA